MKPLILVTNDDGIDSPGILAAAEALDGLGEILIAAPWTQQTGMGRSFQRIPDLGIIEETQIMIHDTCTTGYRVHGSPAYAVAHGVLELASRKPDLCISGINYGENLGLSLTCSGTVGAIFEAHSHGIPAIALSLQADLKDQRRQDYAEMNWDTAKKVTRCWAEKMLSGNLPFHTDLININIPAVTKIAGGCRITRQSRQNYFEFLKPMPRDWNKPFELKAQLHVHEENLEADSDIYAVYADYTVSVTPLNWDLTMPF